MVLTRFTLGLYLFEHVAYSIRWFPYIDGIQVAIATATMNMSKIVLVKSIDIADFNYHSSIGTKMSVQLLGDHSSFSTPQPSHFALPSMPPSSKTDMMSPLQISVDLAV